jgi:hypothetical protein
MITTDSLGDERENDSTKSEDLGPRSVGKKVSIAEASLGECGRYGIDERN